MRWIHPLSPEVVETAEVLGGKAHGLIVLRRLGLPVPPGFVIGTGACRSYIHNGRLPDGLEPELETAVAGLQADTSRTPGPGRPLAVSVRSGGQVSMPGMMTTVLDLDVTAGDPTALARLTHAVTTVFSSWHNPRARTYRELHDIPHHLGTAVTVQAMVFGDRDSHSGAGVAFSRDPTTGQRVPFGDVLFGHRGDDVVSGRTPTRPLTELAGREPAVWDALRDALHRVERHYRDACHLEFTYQTGALWLLQVRAGGSVGAAAVRIATDLADEGLIGRDEALLRVSPRHLRIGTPRLVVDAAGAFARGLGAGPGVAVGRIATTADAAVRMATVGAVILVRPDTSPLDLHGIAAAAGVVTARGGPASHAAVVARAMGRPAVVGVTGLTVTDASVRAGGRTVTEGTLIAIDGTGGEVVLGSPRIVTTTTGPHLHRLLGWADTVTGNTTDRPESERLSAAQAVLRSRTHDRPSNNP